MDGTSGAQHDHHVADLQATAGNAAVSAMLSDGHGGAGDTPDGPGDIADRRSDPEDPGAGGAGGVKPQADRRDEDGDHGRGAADGNKPAPEDSDRSSDQGAGGAGGTQPQQDGAGGHEGSSPEQGPERREPGSPDSPAAPAPAEFSPLVELELVEHERWGEALSTVGAAGSAKRAGFAAQQAAFGLTKGFSEGYTSALALTGFTRLATRALAKKIPVPIIGSIIGGAIGAWGLKSLASTDAWKELGGKLWTAFQQGSGYDKAANRIEALMTVLDTLGNLLDGIALVCGLIAAVCWLASPPTFGSTVPPAAKTTAIALEAGALSAVLSVAKSALSPVLLVLRALHTYTDRADPRAVRTKGGKIAEAAGAMGAVLGGLAGSKVAGAGADRARLPENPKDAMPLDPAKIPPPPAPEITARPIAATGATAAVHPVGDAFGDIVNGPAADAPEGSRVVASGEMPREYIGTNDDADTIDFAAIAEGGSGGGRPARAEPWLEDMHRRMATQPVDVSPEALQYRSRLAQGERIMEARKGFTVGDDDADTIDFAAIAEGGSGGGRPAPAEPWLEDMHRRMAAHVSPEALQYRSRLARVERVMAVKKGFTVGDGDNAGDAASLAGILFQAGDSPTGPRLYPTGPNPYGAAGNRAADAESYVERVDPQYESPPGTKEQLAALRQQIAALQTQSRTAQSDADSSGADRAVTESRAAQIQQLRNTVSETQAEAGTHEKELSETKSANNEQQNRQHAAGAGIGDAASKVASLGTMEKLLDAWRASAGFVASLLRGVAVVIPSAGSGADKCQESANDAAAFMAQLGSAREIVTNQITAAPAQEAKLAADEQVLTAEDARGEQSKADLELAQAGLDAATTQNELDAQAAASHEAQSRQDAATAADDTTKTQAEHDQLEAALQAWAGRHAQQRRDAFDATSQKLLTAGFEVVERRGE